MTLPTRGSGESGALHLADHNAMHARFNQLGGLTIPAEGYPAATAGPLAEFYNAMMSHFDGERATPFFVNPQHPDFGAIGISESSNNDVDALNEAAVFATLQSTQGGMRALWIPATNRIGTKARYYVDSPFKVQAGLSVWGYGARIAASPRFDFVTKFPTNNWGDLEQGIVEGYNFDPTGSDPLAGGRLRMARYNLRGLLIEGLNIPGSIGAIFNMQQQSTWHQVRINAATRIGLLVSGQQGIFHDLMVTGSNPDFGPSATYPMIGIQLGMPDYVGADVPASFFWFYGTNIESQYRGVYQWRGLGANSFRDTHLEGVDSADPADMAYCFYQNRGQLVIDQASWWLTPGINHGTFLKAEQIAGSTAPTYNMSDIFISGGSPPNDNAIFLDDPTRDHFIRAWGNTKLSEEDQDGIVRQVYSFIGASLADSVYPRKHVITIAHDEGGYTAFGSYNSGTADANQQPLLRMRPGATQMGHLVSWYDKAGVERYLITADGMPKLPGYTAATKPTAVAREAVMIYDLDTNKVQISDGSAWVNLH